MSEIYQTNSQAKATKNQTSQSSSSLNKIYDLTTTANALSAARWQLTRSICLSCLQSSAWSSSRFGSLFIIKVSTLFTWTHYIQSILYINIYWYIFFLICHIPKNAPSSSRYNSRSNFSYRHHDNSPFDKLNLTRSSKEY